MRRQYPRLLVREFDLSSPANKEINEAVAARCGVPERHRLVPASIFIGHDYLQMGAITRAAWPPSSPAMPWPLLRPTWVLPAQVRAQAAQRITGRFRALGPLTIVVAGLLDGVNPCALATLVFFISFLAAIGRQRRDLLVVGVAYAIGMFCAYFLMGLGALTMLRLAVSWHGLARAINYAVAAFAFVLALLSFADFRQARRGNMAGITLQLPASLKRRIHQAIHAHMHTTHYLGATFLLGVVLALLESVCTGQVYLPTIIYVLKEADPAPRRHRLLATLQRHVHCPHAGRLPSRLPRHGLAAVAAFSRAHVAPVKLATAILFLGLGCVVLLVTVPLTVEHSYSFFLLKNRVGTGSRSGNY